MLVAYEDSSSDEDEGGILKVIPKKNKKVVPERNSKYPDLLRRLHSRYPGISLPEKSKKDCSDTVRERFKQYFRAQEEGNGFTFMKQLEGNKNFGNPKLLEKVADLFDISDTGTNFAKNIWDPRNIPKEHDYKVLSRKQAESGKTSRRGFGAPVSFVQSSS